METTPISSSALGGGRGAAGCGFPAGSSPRTAATPPHYVHAAGYSNGSGFRMHRGDKQAKVWPHDAQWHSGTQMQGGIEAAP
jgi:hypothetical protein